MKTLWKKTGKGKNYEEKGYILDINKLNLSPFILVE